jgi:myo-inositol-1(or 4)-monophosphatase
MRRPGLQRYLDVGLAAVLDAGPIALEYFRKRLRVDDKRHGDYFDPVTDADRRIETCIRERLMQAFPGLRIAGEEHGSVGDGSTYWIIDPIDGTRSFISGMPTWGILLGLVVEDRPTIGIMHQPYTGETWIADPEHGARIRSGGIETPLRVRTDAKIEDAVLYSTHPAMLQPPPLLERFESLSARCRLQRWGGDCYSYALLAQGCIDIVVDASLMPYDIVPLVPIIEGAGGIVTDIEGRTPLGGGTVIAAASPALHASALDAMRGGIASS